MRMPTILYIACFFVLNGEEEAFCMLWKKPVHFPLRRWARLTCCTELYQIIQVYRLVINLVPHFKSTSFVSPICLLNEEDLREVLMLAQSQVVTNHKSLHVSPCFVFKPYIIVKWRGGCRRVFKAGFALPQIGAAHVMCVRLIMLTVVLALVVLGLSLSMFISRF